MYDRGIYTFSTTVTAAVLPVCFDQDVAACRLTGNMASIYCGYVNAVALLLTTLLAPILARFPDCTGGKK